MSRYSAYVLTDKYRKPFTKNGLAALRRALDNHDLHHNGGYEAYLVFPHRLRHTYATRLVESGMDIKTAQYLMGHSNVDILLGVYAHYDVKSRLGITAEHLNIIFSKDEKTGDLAASR